jgi:hypothetical protein
MTQRIEPPRQPSGNTNDNGSLWSPEPGNELAGFLQTINRPPEVCERIQKEAIAVLGGCINPAVGGAKTGLVLGRVQSGKTSSFTAVSALAHDNNYKMVIVIAGTTELLVKQTSERLAHDLRLTSQNAFNRWTMCTISSSIKAEESAGMENLKMRIRAMAHDPNPLFAGVPIVIVMKNHIHLTRLNNLLKDMATIEGIDFSKFPALIIDDEAHMHTPDVSSKDADKPSAVYECMRTLANNFPNRSLLQYTATPQANLLMEIGDELSPDFVRLLEPGPGYAGGKEIFGTLPNKRIRNVSETEYPKNPKPTDSPPQSLLSATANFLLSCAVDVQLTGVANSRSMLVHSDVSNTTHKVFEDWLKTICDAWLGLLRETSINVPKVFVDELKDLQDGDDRIAKANITIDSCRPVIIQVLTALRIQTVNYRSDVGQVNYNLAPYWIINGGNMLGVGYTVEGLVTTHMMRKPGAGMADTIQQRGRFFGYLNERFSQVRVFITSTMAKRFMDYAEHEEGLRTSLAKFDSSNPAYDNINQPKLKDWKRVFWLDPAMIPTRKKAQRLLLERARIEKDGWLPQRHLPLTSSDKQNREALNNFIESVDNDPGNSWHVSSTWGGAPGAHSTTHLRTEVSLKKLLTLISDLNFSSEDEGDINSALLAIEENCLDLDSDTATVIFMAQGSRDRSPRKRTVPNGQSVDLFQGRGEGRGAYVGDRKVFDPLHPTLQIHLLDIFLTKQHGVKAHRSKVPVIALHLPKPTHDWAKNLLKQP